jgi:transcriptional regulator with XRE-family HTH domain
MCVEAPGGGKTEQNGEKNKRSGEKTMPRVRKPTTSEVRTTSLAAYASQLRAWRRHMGWTQEQLAEKIGYSESLISGIESMDKPPTADFAAACDRGFGTPGFSEDSGTPGTFMTLQALVAREAYPAFFAPVVSFEGDAARIHGWELGAVPGLLQTEHYARALIRVSRPMDTGSDIDRLVAARMERQAILAREHPRPPVLWYVIDEGALRRTVGGLDVMSAQLDRIIEAASTPGIVIQVLPFTADHVGIDGPISIYEFDGNPTVCYTECYSGGRIVEEPAEVIVLTTVMSMLRASALPPRDSIELIRQIRSET